MNTGLTNLGPSFKGMAGLGAKSRGEEKSLGIDSKKDFQVSDFEKVLGSRTNELEKLQNAKDETKRPQVPKSDALESRSENTSTRLEPKSGPIKDRPEKGNSEKVAEKGINPKSNSIADKRETGKLETTVKAKNDGELEKSSVNAEKKAEIVMQQFMDSLESELGIPPEDIVEAMTELPKAQLLQSPESTASQVIGKLSDKLSLSKDEQDRAMELYLGMLQQLQQPILQPKQPMLMGAFGGASLLAASKLANQEKLQGLQNSLDKMNDQFFSPQKLVTETDLNSPTEFPLPKISVNAADIGSEMVNLNAVPPVDLPAADVASGMKLDGMTAVDPKSPEAQELLKSLAAISASAAGVNQALSQDPAIRKALQNENLLNQLKADGLISDSASSSSAADAMPSAGLASAGLGAAFMSAKSQTEKEGFGSQSQSSESETTFGELGEVSAGDFSKVQDLSNLKPMDPANLPQHQNTKDATVSGLAAAAMLGKSEAMSPQQQALNTQRLMNQAQILLKQGGGEAKISMAPEGIGQIHMKMTLLDGKMNLEMQAESKESKKLIESSIGDLRTSLGHHNIAVDQIKVDLSQKSGFDPQSGNSQQQNMADSRQEPSKEQMRNFWNQFEGGSERRNQFNDGSGIRAYGGQRREAPLKAVDAGSSSVAPRQLGSGKGRGLNLVA